MSSERNKATRHPLEGQPGFTRYLLSEKISSAAGALITAWEPISSPENLDKAERFLDQWVKSGDALSFPFEKEPSRLDLLELATYNHEASLIQTIAVRLMLAKSFKSLREIEPAISAGKSQQELHEQFMGAIQKNSRSEDKVASMVYLGTKAWLEIAAPLIASRETALLEAIREEQRITNSFRYRLRSIFTFLSKGSTRSDE